MGLNSLPDVLETDRYKFCIIARIIVACSRGRGGGVLWDHCAGVALFGPDTDKSVDTILSKIVFWVK